MKQSLLLYLTILAVLFFYFYLYVLSKQVDFEQNRYKKQQKIKRQHRFSIQSVGGCQLFFHWQKMRMHKIILILEVQRK
jgi:hypothetical protein